MKEENIIKAYRHLAAFGKRIEYYVIGRMLKEGLDVFLPMVDDDAIDAVIKKPDGTFIEVQIKARSRDVKFGSAALFAGIPHDYRPNYWFVFYSERMSEQEHTDIFWILSSHEFVENSGINKNGKNKGKRWIRFNGKRKNREPAYPRYEKYRESNFDRIKNENPNM